MRPAVAIDLLETVAPLIDDTAGLLVVIGIIFI